MADALTFLEGAYNAAVPSAPATAEALKTIARAVDSGQVDPSSIAQHGEALLNGILSDLDAGIRVNVSLPGSRVSTPAPAPVAARRWFD